jgi:hypothetical protein
VAQTSVRDVCDVLIPLEAEVESFHASAAAFSRPQSSSLRNHQHPARQDRVRLYTPALVNAAFLLCCARMIMSPFGPIRNAP